MRVYVLREDATELDFEDILMDAFTTKEEAMQAADVSLDAWLSMYDQPGPKDSGWVTYSEVSSGGWTRELNFHDGENEDASVDHFPSVTLIFKIYEMEVR